MATFNPNLPATSSPLSSAEMRSQLNALKALVDQCPTNDDMRANTSGSLGAIGPLGLTISTPPTHDQVQMIADQLDMVIEALNRV